MLELASALLPLLRSGESVAVATVTRVARSAPRGAGAAMAVTRDGRVVGSISGGCVEGDTVVLASHALVTGVGASASFGFTDAQAHAAGLACGGAVDVVVSVVRPDSLAHDALERAARGARTSVGIVMTGPEAGRVVAPDHDAGDTHMLSAAYEGADVLIVVSAPPPRLLIYGAGEHAAALCRVGAASGFSVTVCDPWARLLTPERFPDAAELVDGYPHVHLESLGKGDVDDRTAVCVLTHDERLDVPALRAALALPVGFVGAMGARSTVTRRAALLRQSGVGDEALARLHSPLGLDLGGSTPEFTALAILAEIVATRHGGTGLPLRDLTGPLHADTHADTHADAEQTTDAAASCTLARTP